MDVVVDASARVGELLRRRGRWILTHPEIALYMAPPQWDEALHELTRRVRHVAARLDLNGEELLTEARALAEATITIVPEEVYGPFLEEARRRIEDPDDRPTLVLALALEAGVWTSDLDFFGSGVATRRTDWSNEQIHEFWKTHDSADYREETDPVEGRAERPRQRAVSVKLDERDIALLKRIAKEKGIGHTTLIRLWIKEKLREQPAP